MAIRPHKILPLGVFVTTLVTYLRTLAPGLAGGDAGELTLSAGAFGVAHPPGYPLFILLGHLTSWAPLGSLSFRLNLFSALCGAGAAALLSAAVLRLSRSAPAALAAAGLFALAPLTWTWSTRTDVFALANLCAAALLWASARHATAPTPYTLGWGGLLVGLGLCNHHTFVLLAAPVAGWAVWQVWRQPWRGRALLLATGAGLLGLLPYALLPLAARHAPEQSWGDATTLDGLLRLVLRQDYGTFRLEQQTSVEAVPQALRLLGASALRTTLGIGAVASLVVLGSRARAVTATHGLRWALAAGWLLAGPAFLLLARFPLGDALREGTLARFFLLPNLVLSCLAGWGLGRMAEGLRARAAGVGCAVAVLVQFGWTLAARQRPEVSYAERWAAAVLQPLPPRSVVLVRGDLLSNALRYARHGAGLRADVAMVDLELLTYPWYARAVGASIQVPAERYFPGAAGGFSLAQLVAANAGRPFLVAGLLKPGDPSIAQFALRPEGLVQRLVPRGESTAANRWQPPPDLAQLARSFPEDPWDAAILEEYWEAHHLVAVEALRAAIASGAAPAEYAAVAAQLEALIAEHPRPPAAYFRNLGIAYGRAGMTAPMRLAFRNYLQRAPEAPDRDLIRAQLTSP